MDKTRLSPRMRQLGLIWLLAFLIWLPLEDQSIWWGVVLAAAASAWLVANKLFDVQGGTLRRGMLGSLWGLGTVALAVVLMGFKSGVHAHGFSDFTLSQIGAVLQSTPIWLLAGVAGMILLGGPEKSENGRGG